MSATITDFKNKLANKSDTAANLIGFTSWVRVGETGEN